MDIHKHYRYMGRVKNRQYQLEELKLLNKKYRINEAVGKSLEKKSENIFVPNPGLAERLKGSPSVKVAFVRRLFQKQETWDFFKLPLFIITTMASLLITALILTWLLNYIPGK